MIVLFRIPELRLLSSEKTPISMFQIELGVLLFLLAPYVPIIPPGLTTDGCFLPTPFFHSLKLSWYSPSVIRFWIRSVLRVYSTDGLWKTNLWCFSFLQGSGFLSFSRNPLSLSLLITLDS